MSSLLELSPGALTAELAKATRVLDVLQFVAARLWLVSTRLAIAATFATFKPDLAEAQLLEVEGGLSDVIVGLNEVYAAILRTEAEDAHVGVVTVGDSAWLWREMVRGLRLDMPTAPKAAAELAGDLFHLATLVRLHARAFGSVARRAEGLKQAQLVLVTCPPAAAPPEPFSGCPGCAHPVHTPELCGHTYVVPGVGGSGTPARGCACAAGPENQAGEGEVPRG